MASRKIQITSNYRLFQRHEGENRPLDLKKHRKLKESMVRYGFLECFPIVVVRAKDGVLVVKDGQHRLVIAEELGQPVAWVEEDVDFDVAIVNSTAKVWALRDYAQKHVANGLTAYEEGLNFADSNSLPIGIAFALLAGTTAFGNCKDAFMDGDWKIKDRPWAHAVASVYTQIVLLNPALNNQRFMEACMAVCRVGTFDPKRLIQNGDRCRVPYAKRDAYLEMLEQVYNFGRKQLVGLKAAALMAMRERNPGKAKAKKAAETVTADA